MFCPREKRQCLGRGSVFGRKYFPAVAIVSLCSPLLGHDFWSRAVLITLPIPLASCLLFWTPLPVKEALGPGFGQQDTKGSLSAGGLRHFFFFFVSMTAVERELARVAVSPFCLERGHDAWHHGYAYTDIRMENFTLTMERWKGSGSLMILLSCQTQTPRPEILVTNTVNIHCGSWKHS